MSINGTDPFADPGLPRLDEVLAKFELMPTETAARKTRVRGAVATLSRMLGRAPNAIPAHPTFLARQLRRLRHRPTGLTAKSVSNCGTELRHLVRTVCGTGSHSSFGPLTGDWLAFREPYKDLHLIWALSRFMTFCCANGIAPNDVDDAAVPPFRAAIADCNEIGATEKYVRQTIRAWNRMAKISPEWTMTLLTLEPVPRRAWAMSPTEFTPSFQADVDQWLRHLAIVVPEDDGGSRQPLRPTTLRARRYQLYQAASALVRSGRPVEEITGIADLVQLDAFKSLMKLLRERAGGAPTVRVLNIGRALASAARHHVRADDALCQAMKRICKKYETEVSGAPSRRRAKLAAFEDEKVFASLLHLPDRLMAEALAAGVSRKSAGYLAMIAIAVEIEIVAPMRRANLARLNLHRHIQPVTVGRERRWLMNIPANETKNRTALVYEIPAESVSRIERAMRLYEQRDGWLFPGAKGSHMTLSNLGIAVKREVERRLGVPLHLHLFRQLMASLQVKEHENGFERARALLGDRSERVVRQHYTVTAERHLIAKAQDTIAKVRIRTAPLAPRRHARRTE